MRQFQEGINRIAGRNLEVDAGICMHAVSPTIYIQRSIPDFVHSSRYWSSWSQLLRLPRMTP